jgi:hypothetical protein
MRAISIIKLFTASVLLASFGAWISGCEDTAGPSDPDSNGLIPDVNSLKDSADSAKYFHALYKGKWLCIKDTVITYWPGDQFIPAGFDTTDRLSENEYLMYLDSTFFFKYTTSDTTFRDILRFKVTNKHFCSSSYGDNYVNYECSPHYFKGPDTLDFSDSSSDGSKQVWVFIRAD